MNLKTRISLNLSIAFSIIITAVMTVIYFSFSKFRKDEFRDNLENSSLITANYISRIPESELQNEEKSIANIDHVEEDHLLNEKVLVFNSNKKLIFSNVFDRKVTWDAQRLDELDRQEKIFWNNRGKENIGIRIPIKGKNYYILTEAEDITGNAKLHFLGIILVALSVFSVMLIWVFSYFFMKKQLRPLDDFKDTITDITAHQLTIQLPEQSHDDEINVMIKAFNTMMKRLNKAFRAQQEFTSSASHEIKTPLTRIAFKLENLERTAQDEMVKKEVTSMQGDIFHLSDTVNSLLFLSKVEENGKKYFEDVRLDEVIFDAFEHVKKNFPAFEMDFNITEQTDDGDLTVQGVKSLLEIVFVNLFKNAALYSKVPAAAVEVSEDNDDIKVRVMNRGDQLREDETKKIFEAFSRGSNAPSKTGSGLGLRITRRIMEYHNGKISYQKEDADANIFILVLPVHE